MKVWSDVSPWPVKCVCCWVFPGVSQHSYCKSPGAHRLENPSDCGFDSAVWYFPIRYSGLGFKIYQNTENILPFAAHFPILILKWSWWNVDWNCKVSGIFHFYYMLRDSGILDKGRGKFTLEQGMKAQRGSRGVVVLFLQPRRKMGWVVSATPRPLYPGMTRYPSYRRLGGFQGRSGPMRNILPPLGFDPRTIQPVTIRYPGPQELK
jgi:hypothetical protein